MTLSWNVLFVMILPLVIDWSERRHFKARFLKLEEVARTNPELAAVLNEQCQKLSLPGLRLAVVDGPVDEVFSYGLWRQNPRLFVSDSLLATHETAALVPSIEAELNRFANQDHTLIFILFTVFQVILQQLLLTCRLLS